MPLQKFDQQAERIIRAMLRDAVPFPEDREEQARRKARCEKDLLAFAETYLPHYCSDAFAPMHREWAAMANKDGLRAIAAPRGFAKSVLFSLAQPLRQGLFKRRHFWLHISDTADQATDQLAFIKLEIEENTRIKQDFGDMKLPGRWETADFILRSGTRFKALGKRQKVRGLRNRQYRPDGASIDDFEDDATVLNQKLTDKGWDWVCSAVLPAMAKDSKEVWFLGQRLTPHCALSQALEAEGWEDHVYRAADDEGHSAWPQRFSDAELAGMKRDMGTAAFNREMLNIPRPTGEHPFKAEWVKRYTWDWLKQFPPHALPVYGFIDPSAKAGENNDYKAKIYIGRTPDGKFPVISAWIRKASIDALARSVYEDYRTLKPMRIGCETNGFQSVLLPLFDTYQREYGFLVPVVGVDHVTQSKDYRITRMSPFVERGLLMFPEGTDPDMALLIEQLLYYPDAGMKKDGPDALEGALALAEADAYAFSFASTGQRRAGVRLEGY